MSTVQYFDDIPHIGRFGMRDDDGGTSWTMFYRNGTNFTIHVDEKDVSATAFHSLWRPLLGDEPKEGESLTDSYNKFFDLVVSHSLSTLQEIDPVKPHWITLRDYLHTPAYELKLVADSSGTDGVRAVVTKGPESEGAYEFQPTTALNHSEVFKQRPDRTGQRGRLENASTQGSHNRWSYLLLQSLRAKQYTSRDW